MFVLDILPSKVALVVVMVLTGKRRISEELAVSPGRFRRCLAAEARWHLENEAGRVTVLPPRLIFISKLLIVLEFRTCPDALIEGPNKLCLCLFSDSLSPSNSADCSAFCDFRIR